MPNAGRPPAAAPPRAGAELALRLRVVAPPPGVRWALQLGRADLAPPTRADGDVEFAVAVRAVLPPAGPPDFRGPAVQGPPGGRFVYLNSGASAGQADSPWRRRAKVPLAGLTRALVERALAEPGAALAAAVAGAARDGGPAAATVPLLGGGWRVAPGA